MTHRVISANAQSFDICDEASVLSIAASVADRPPRHASDTLTSAIGHPYRIRRLNDSSRHCCARLQYVDICDEAFVLDRVALITDRVILGCPTRVDICDRAFALGTSVKIGSFITECNGFRCYIFGRFPHTSTGPCPRHCASATNAWKTQANL